MMTLDEAIKHCHEKAEEQRAEAPTWIKDGWQKAFKDLTPEKEAEYLKERQIEHDSCLECASEHEQLAEWLKELKAFRKAIALGELVSIFPKEAELKKLREENSSLKKALNDYD